MYIFALSSVIIRVSRYFDENAARNFNFFTTSLSTLPIMKLSGFTIFVFSFFFIGSLSAQRNFHLQVGMNVGASRLYHNTNFQTSKLIPLYKTIEITHKDGYSWEQFEEDFGLRQAYNQPRFGFSGTLSYRNWPVCVIGELMSSPSSYTKTAYSVTVALGKNFDLGDSGFFVTGLGGYQFVKDLALKPWSTASVMMNCVAWYQNTLHQKNRWETSLPKCLQSKPELEKCTEWTINLVLAWSLLVPLI